MAYMSQERKNIIAPLVRAICKKYGVKASLAVRHHSTLVLNISQGPIDFYSDYAKPDDARQHGIQVNPYWYQDHFTGRALKFLTEVIPALNAGNHDRSDIQSDYFDVGWYVDVNIGRWNRPYALVR